MAYEDAPKRRSMPAAMKPSATALATRAENSGEELSKLIRTSRELRTGSTLNPPLTMPAALRSSSAALAAVATFFFSASAFDCGRSRASMRPNQPGSDNWSSAAWSRLSSLATRSASERLLISSYWVCRKSGSQP